MASLVIYTLYASRIFHLEDIRYLHLVPYPYTFIVTLRDLSLVLQVEDSGSFKTDQGKLGFMRGKTAHEGLVWVVLSEDAGWLMRNLKNELQGLFHFIELCIGGYQQVTPSET